MRYEIKMEIVLTGKAGADWDDDIATQMIRNHLEYSLPYLPWIKDNVQGVVVKKVEAKAIKEE